ncbi:MAG: hypothetical protein HYZ54_10600 [Ignavibacteriae bacterium]|nr:hypothetical protein [Ignavibacteriota bacterium]
MTKEQEHEIELLHERACARGELEYRDPLTEYIVFTRIKHLERGTCCGSGCRHCPYGHINVNNKSH